MDISFMPVMATKKKSALNRRLGEIGAQRSVVCTRMTAAGKRRQRWQIAE
jgi:hypothetical protein